MNAKDFTEFHTLVEQFEREVSLKDICSQEGVDYCGYMRMCATIREEMKSDPRDSRNVYVFINRIRTIIRMLHYEHGFPWPRAAGCAR